MIFRALRATCARSASVARGIFGPRCERSEGSSQKTRAEGTTPSGPRVSLHAFRAELNRNSFFSWDDPYKVF